MQRNRPGEIQRARSYPTGEERKSGVGAERYPDFQRDRTPGWNRGQRASFLVFLCHRLCIEAHSQYSMERRGLNYSLSPTLRFGMPSRNCRGRAQSTPSSISCKASVLEDRPTCRPLARLPTWNRMFPPELFRRRFCTPANFTMGCRRHIGPTFPRNTIPKFQWH